MLACKRLSIIIKYDDIVCGNKCDDVMCGDRCDDVQCDYVVCSNQVMMFNVQCDDVGTISHYSAHTVKNEKF